MNLGYLNMCTKRAPQGIAECEHALELDKNLAAAHGCIGLGKLYVGRPEETEAHIVEALRLSPRDTLAYAYMQFVGVAKIFLGVDDQAVAWLRRSIESNRNFPQSHFYLAVALARLGRLDEARSAVKAGLALNPALTVSRLGTTLTTASDDPTFLAGCERLLDGLRKAGMPEGPATTN
jgi:tetratricopeptide (TPR) repeat protein